MSTQELIAAHIAANGLTRCAPAHADGNETKGLSRAHVAQKRAAWSQSNGVALKVGQVKG